MVLILQYLVYLQVFFQFIQVVIPSSFIMDYNHIMTFIITVKIIIIKVIMDLVLNFIQLNQCFILNSFLILMAFIKIMAMYFLNYFIN